MNLSFLRRLFAATFITGSILLPTANALADVIQSPEATISNINPTCCNCVNAQNNIRGFFEIPHGTNCTNFKDETSVRGTRPASDFANITCTSVASCPNPKQASQLYTTLNTAPQPNIPAAPPRPLVTPTLSVPIPGLTLGPATRQGDTVSVPFLSQYISGIYRYGIGIVGLVSTIMAIYGGFRYLLGASTGDIKTGKTIMTNAVVGMVLVFASYAIIYTINPELTQLKALELRTIDPVELAIAETLATTQQETAEPGESTPTTPTAGAVTGNCPIPGLPPNPAPTISINPSTGRSRSRIEGSWKRNPRTRAFFEQIGTIATATTLQEKITQIANAAVQCQITMDACGNTAGAIWAMAGVGPLGADCINSSEIKSCWTQSRSGVTIFHSSSEGVRTGTIRCIEAAGNRCSPTTNYEGCLNSTPEAIASVKRQLETSTRPGLRGYPDTIVDRLQVGDIFEVYNGNQSCGSSHALIFVGWATANGRARVVNGQYGSVAWSSTVCLKRACGNYEPVTRIYRPRQ